MSKHGTDFVTCSPGQKAQQLFAILLPDAFPEDALATDFEPNSVATLNFSERAALWGYLYTLTNIAPELQSPAQNLLATVLPEETAQLVLKEHLLKVLSRLRPKPTARAVLFAPPPALVEAITRGVIEVVRHHFQPRRPLDGLTKAQFEHPQDANTLQSIKKLPSDWLSKVQDFFNQGLQIELLANSILITEQTLPSVFRSYQEAGRALGVSELPPLYLRSGGFSATTIGVDQPSIVVESTAVNLLDKEELIFFLGRELGHVLAGHVKYQLLLDFYSGAAESVGAATFRFGRVLLNLSVGLQLSKWYRFAEITADRAGYLACQNHEAALRTLLKISGFPPRAYQELRTHVLVEQVGRFRARVDTGAMDRMFDILNTATQKEPFTVHRATELLSWLESDDYRRLVEQYEIGQRR